jgi:hypothetical protein
MKSKVNFFREKRGSALVQVIVIVEVIILVAVTVGMFRFNFLASLDDFDVDGNKVNVQEEVASVEKKKEVPKTMEKTAIESGNETKSKLEDEVEVIKETGVGDKQEEAKEVVIKKYGDFKFNENTTLEVRGNEVYMNNVISDGTLRLFKKMIKENPQVDTLVEVDMPGSENDIVMIDLGYYVRSLGLNTKILSYSKIDSGAVDLFLAGTKRFMVAGARIGVHSWADEDGTEAKDYPEDSEEHDANADYIEDMLGTNDFYWFTIYAAEAEDIHEMTTSEIKKYNIINTGVLQ